MPVHVRPLSIRFRDVDALDHVNHAVMLTYCETIRCDWFQDVAGYPSMANLPFIVASAHIEYKSPMPKTAALEVGMWVSRLGGKSWDFDYELRDAKSGTVFATARTVQVGYDYKVGKTVEPPAKLRSLLESIAAPPDAALAR